MDGNVTVGYRYSIGVAMAILKPNYLKMMQIDYTITPSTAILVENKYTREDSALFLNPQMILGASRWEKSLSEMQYIPGCWGEAAITIVPGKAKTFVQVITLGANASLFANNLPIMQGQHAYPWQACLFAGLGIGKRWK